MEHFRIILNQEIVFIITIAIGYMVFKLRLLEKDSLQTLSSLFSNVTLPFLILVNTVEGAARKDLTSSFYVIAIEIAMYVVLISFNRLMIRLCRLRENRARIYLLSASFGNMGFVGIPLIMSVYGQRAMIYVSLFTLVDQALLWTYGVSLSHPYDSSEAKLRFDKSTLKKLLNPPLIATICALILISFNLKFPASVGTAFRNISNASIPLPFLYLGGMLAISDCGKILKEWPVYVIAVSKMLIFPVVLFVCLRCFGLNSEVNGVFLVLAGLPCLAVAPMLAKENGSDETLATAATSLTTVASIITFPILFYITSLI